MSAAIVLATIALVCFMVLEIVAHQYQWKRCPINLLFRVKP